ncbi:MAG TPA: hypothetical protein VH478_23845 [Trebonia sp.]|nr:hypothetical protein [Trebonia sp.]
MSVSSRTPVPGQSTPAPDSGAPTPELIARDPAGLLLARLTVLPVVVATAFLLASFPLLLIGWFRPVPTIVAAVIVAAVIVPLGWRRLPGLVPSASASAGGLRVWAQPADADGERDGRRTPWWTVVALLVIAIGFFAFEAAYHSQFLIISRDPGSYMQFATWIAGHGSLPIPTNSQAFGNDPSLWYQGFAMYQVGNTIVPQFMAGLPMALSVGYWFGGVNGALLLGPFFGAVAIVVFGGLAARLLGARWAPLAALVLAASLPQMYTSRNTFSEPLAQVLFLGGLALLIDSLRAQPAAAGPGTAGAGLRARVARWDSGRVLALLAGLALGIALLVRIDAPSDILPLIPYCGLMWVRGQRQAMPLVIGIIVGWAWGWVDAVFLSWPYVFQTNKSSSLPMIAGLALAIVVTVLAALWLRRRARATGGLPQLGEHWWLPGWLPRAATIVPFIVIAAFALRSHVQHNFVKEQYAQLSLHWVYWYLGGPAIALATIGVAILGFGALRGRWPAWTLPLMCFAWDILLFLYRPGITPDQPWASRRLVPAVLPGFILLSIWLVAWTCGRLGRGEVPGVSRLARLLAGKRRALITAGVASVCALLLVVPTAITTRGLAFKRTFQGQVAAIYGLCAKLPSDASVIIVDSPMADRLSQVVRGMCDVPVTRFHYSGNVYTSPTAPTSQVLAAIHGVQSVGRQPVLLAAHTGELAPYTNQGTITKAVTMHSTMDGRSLTAPPTKIATEDLDVWMLEPTR